MLFTGYAAEQYLYCGIQLVSFGSIVAAFATTSLVPHCSVWLHYQQERSVILSKQGDDNAGTREKDLRLGAEAAPCSASVRSATCAKEDEMSGMDLEARRRRTRGCVGTVFTLSVIWHARNARTMYGCGRSRSGEAVVKREGRSRDCSCSTRDEAAGAVGMTGGDGRPIFGRLCCG